MIRIFQLALYMGFKHIIIVGCDCSDTYKRVLKLWKHAFNESNKLYPKVNIFIYNPVNLKLKPTFNLLNIMIIKKNENKYYFNKYLFDRLFKNNTWKSFTFNNLNFKSFNNELGYIESEEEIKDNVVKITGDSILKYLFNHNLSKISTLIVSDTIKNIFNKQTIVFERENYNNSNKLLMINNNTNHEKIINININYKENVIIIQNNYKMQSIILGKIVYFLTYYNIKVTHKNIVDILILAFRFEILFNIISIKKICCEDKIDNKFFF